MITKVEYEELLKSSAIKKFLNVNINWGSWHTQYCYYESMWETYFLEFITEYSKLPSPPPEIKFVFWESCPGGMPFPHQNYAFDSSRSKNPIRGDFDRYLKNVCTTFNIDWKKKDEKKKDK